MSGRTTLAEREREHANSLDPSARAKRLAPTLEPLALELRQRFLGNGIANPELSALYVERLRQAADLLRTLETEVFRLRQAIGCHRYGRIEDRELWQVARTWNCDSDQNPKGGNEVPSRSDASAGPQDIAQ